MGPRILVAEDDAKQASLIRVYLEREGNEVHLVSNGRAAIDHARTHRPDLIVLDVMMPLVDGLDVCRVLRTESQVPILLLTARTTEEDVLLGLDLGADDYMTKPYSPRELAARVRALLRRSRVTSGGAANFPGGAGGGDDMVIDPYRFEVRIAGEAVPLTAKEFAILQVLALEPGRVFTRREIIEQAFSAEEGVLERTVDVHVVNLRRKLEADGRRRRFVETVYGRGYRLSVRNVSTPQP
ncbi:response regulator transcription factor [Streptomyces sp. NPDC047315]|uniref:response regulator transcription factor n=1 Tax=Streptomyces sp. NPDC047315 TaxID=3155142 RepID=UPI0033F51229